MGDVQDYSELRKALAVRGVEALLAATPGTVAFDGEEDRWTRPHIEDAWYDGAGNEVSSEKLAGWGGEIAFVGVSPAVLRDLLDELDWLRTLAVRVGEGAAIPPEDYARIGQYMGGRP